MYTFSTFFGVDLVSLGDCIYVINTVEYQSNYLDNLGSQTTSGLNIWIIIK